MEAQTHVNRQTTRTVGILFLAAMLAYGIGSGLVTSVTGASDVLARADAHSTRVEFGGILMLANSVVVAGIGVLLLPVLRMHSSTVAAGYLAARIIEATVLAVGIIFILLLPPLANASVGTLAEDWHVTAANLAIAGSDIAYQIAMISLALGSLPFCTLLLRTRLVPRGLAVWGIAGYAIFLAGAVLELFGVGAGLALSIPGGLFELALGLWLILRGFSPLAGVADPATTGAHRA